MKEKVNFNRVAADIIFNGMICSEAYQELEVMDQINVADIIVDVCKSLINAPEDCNG